MDFYEMRWMRNEQVNTLYPVFVLSRLKDDDLRSSIIALAGKSPKIYVRLNFVF